MKLNKKVKIKLIRQHNFSPPYFIESMTNAVRLTIHPDSRTEKIVEVGNGLETVDVEALIRLRETEVTITNEKA